MNDNKNNSIASKLGYFLGCVIAVCAVACIVALILSVTINLISLMF